MTEQSHEQPQQVPTIADLINDLFRTHRKSNNKEFSTYEVAQAIREQGYTQTTASHIAKLRRGEVANPTRELLLGLCIFFEVSPTYFFPELGNRPLTPPEAIPQDQFRVALRSYNLEPDDQSRIEQIIQQMVSFLSSKKKQ